VSGGLLFIRPGRCRGAAGRPNLCERDHHPDREPAEPAARGSGI